MIKKWQNIFLKGLSAVLLSLSLLIFIGISSANASATPLVKCDFEGANPYVCVGGVMTGGIITTQDPLIGLASNKLNIAGVISGDYELNFSDDFSVDENGLSIVVKVKSLGAWGQFYHNILYFDDNTSLNLWENVWGGPILYSNNAEYFILNISQTNFIAYSDKILWNSVDGHYGGSGSFLTQDYTEKKISKIGGTIQAEGGILIDNFQIYDHLLTQDEIDQLVDTGNINPPEPPTPPALEDPYILYYGNHPYYASINATATLPVVYNICQDWDETKTYQLLLTETASSSPILEGSWLELDSCSGSKNIEFNTGEEEDFYIANIKIIETNTTIVETDNIYFGIVSTIDTSGNMIEFITESPLYINRTGYGTTTVLSFVQMLSEEIATDNEICLLTEKGEKSENCINAEIGIAYKEITIDIPQYDTTQIIKIGLYDENNNLLMTSNSPVMLVIYASFYDTDTWNNQFSSSSASSLIGLNSSQLACSIEEWQDTSWWQTLKCSGKKFVFDIMFILEKLVRAFFGTIMNGMENIFPFSIITNVNQSWTRSATKNLPPDISWIAPEGDIVFTVPANWTGQGTTTEVIAFGDSIFKTGDNSIALFFERIRALSKYLIMAGLVWSFVQFGTYFYWTHLAEEQKE